VCCSGCMLEALKGEICLREALEVMYYVLLCIVEAVESGLVVIRCQLRRRVDPWVQLPHKNGGKGPRTYLQCNANQHKSC
jgi:hypothetical protein